MFDGLWWGHSMDMEQETDMNRIIAVAIAAGGLLFLGSPEAAAHTEVPYSYEPSPYYRYDVRRAHAMPRWLKRDKAFRHWYKHTRLRKHRHLTWHRLFSIYRWETVERRGHRRADRFARYYHDYGNAHPERRRRHGHKR